MVIFYVLAYLIRHFPTQIRGHFSDFGGQVESREWSLRTIYRTFALKCQFNQFWYCFQMNQSSLIWNCNCNARAQLIYLVVFNIFLFRASLLGFYLASVILVRVLETKLKDFYVYRFSRDRWMAPVVSYIL